jgi:hypothetical protein
MAYADTSRANKTNYHYGICFCESAVLNSYFTLDPIGNMNLHTDICTKLVTLL